MDRLTSPGGPSGPPPVDSGSFSREKIATEKLPVHALRVAPPGDREPYLVVLSGTGAGRTVPVRGRLVVGRRGAADLVLQETTVSRLHCAVTVGAGGEVVLEDLGSVNGTFVNDRRAVGRVALREGDRILLGRVVLLKLARMDPKEAGLQGSLFDAALTDGLTGLFNRRYFHQRGMQELAYARRHRLPVALLLLDLDHFKTINDRHGHAAGDHALRWVARTLEGALRAEDVCARLGGDELAVLVLGATARRGLRLARRIHRLLSRRPCRFHGALLPVTVSVGLAILPRGSADSLELLVARADEALYAAKRAGRDTVRASHQ